MDQTRFLVIGAGVTGLSFANWVDSDDYLVLEALHEVGGYCRTIKQDGFVWDFSGHFFHFKNPEIEQYLVERMQGQKISKITKSSKIDYEGHHIDFPFQKNIHQLPKEDFIDCLVDLFTKEDKEKPDNFLDMLYSKLGKGISERMLIPYNEKLYATDLSTLDVDAMGRFFPHANVEEIIRNFRDQDSQSYNSTFTYPEGGAIQYVHALMDSVKHDQICLNERVESIDVDAKVAHTNLRSIKYEHLISSTPFNKLLKMTGTEHDPEIYSYNKVLVFNLGFNKKGIEGVHWMYYPSRDLCFYRLGFYDNIFGTDRMSMYVEIGATPDADMSPARVAEHRSQVLADLKKCGIVTDHELVSEHHIVLDPAYVHITKDSIADVAEKKAQLAAKGIHSAGRYGSWTYCSIEDNIIEAKALAQELS